LDVLQKCSTKNAKFLQIIQVFALLKPSAGTFFDSYGKKERFLFDDGREIFGDREKLFDTKKP